MLNGNNDIPLTKVNTEALMDCSKMKFTVVPCLFLILSGIALAEVPMRQRVVDLVILEDGTRLLGAVTSNKRGKPVEVVVRGSWLKANAPGILDRMQDSKQDTGASDTVAELVRQHIESLRSKPAADQNRIGYLEERLIDLTAQPASEKDDVPDLVVLSLPAQGVRRVIVQNAATPQLALVSILNPVDDVEHIAKKDVVKQLQQIPVTQRVSQLPESKSGPKADESARRQFQSLLLKTDRVLGATCRLIRQSGEYLSETNSSAADLQALTAKMMLGQAQSQLQSLLNENFARPAGAVGRGFKLPSPPILPAAAALLAENENADVVEVTQMDLDPTGGSAEVSIAMYHKGSSTTDWNLLTVVQGRATSRDVTAEQQQKIAGDPRVKQITQLFSGLGVNGNNISSAVSIGACVEIAQQRARQALQDEMASGGGSPLAGLRIVRATLPAAP